MPALVRSASKKPPPHGSPEASPVQYLLIILIGAQINYCLARLPSDQTRGKNKHVYYKLTHDIQILHFKTGKLVLQYKYHNLHLDGHVMIVKIRCFWGRGGGRRL